MKIPPYGDSPRELFARLEQARKEGCAGCLFADATDEAEVYVCHNSAEGGEDPKRGATWWCNYWLARNKAKIYGG